VVALVLGASAGPTFAAPCNVDFRLATAVTLGALQFRVDYGSTTGDFVGAARDVDCLNLTSANPVVFEDEDEQRRLSAKFVALAGIEGPAELARCAFFGTVNPDIDDFVVSVVDASDLYLDPVAAAVVVSRVACSPCGDPNGDGRITAADALFTLRAAIGIVGCGLEACDASGDGYVRANDGLIILKVAVGVPIGIHCEGGGPTTTLPSPMRLSVTKSGSGAGTVTSNPAGIDCGLDCEEPYTEGATVTLTATAASGSHFVAWSGACIGSGTCQVTMSADRSVTATFDKNASACPTDGPITDLTLDCRDLVYIYVGGGIVEGLNTDGHTAYVVQTDGVDVLAYFGPITAARTFGLTHVSMNYGPFYPVLDPGSGGNISSDGTTLNLTIKIQGKTFSFKGAKWTGTEPVSAVATLTRDLSVVPRN
jgi:hypothetical protein